MPSYCTHDNGDRPFEVSLLKKGKAAIKVRRIPVDNAPYEVIADLLFQKMWMGTTSYMSEEKFAQGNSFLFRLNESKYVFVGTEMFEFTLPRGEKVNSFVGDVGNSDVVYPYAITNKRILFLIKYIGTGIAAVSKRRLSNIGFDDMYEQLYNDDQVKEHLEVVDTHVLEDRPETAWYRNHTKRERLKILKRLQLE